MKFFRNRTVLGVICILLSLIICFGLVPIFNRSASEKSVVLRVCSAVQKGEQITESMVQNVTVGAYNLPSDIITEKEMVVGKFAAADLSVGDYILPEKLSDEPADTDLYLYDLTGEKYAVSVTVKSLAAGVSGKLQGGDVVAVIVPNYKNLGESVIPNELQYVKVLAVTAESGADTDENSEEKELPATVTLSATAEQARLLAELDQESEIHLALVYRGADDQAEKFIAEQDRLLVELSEVAQ